MFPGWFKIEGHSNPKPRRGFERMNRLLTREKRLGKGITTSAKKNGPQKYIEPKVRFYKKISVAILFLLGVLGLFLLVRGLSASQSGVATHMEILQIKATGSDEFLSPTEQFRRAAEALYDRGAYYRAYLSFKNAYRQGTVDKKVYLGLLKTTEKVCEEEQHLCEEIVEWQKVVDRLEQIP